MKKIALIIYWLLIISLVGFMITLEQNSGPSIKYIRLLLPVIALIGLFYFESLINLKIKKNNNCLLRRIISVPFIMLGANWLAVFSLTQYRSHHRIIIIPLAILFLSIGILLTHFRLYDEDGMDRKNGVSP